MFIAHFSEEVSLRENVEKFYYVNHDGHKITSEEWPSIVHLAETSRVRLQIKRYGVASAS